MSIPILTRLRAEVLLGETGIIDKVMGLSESFTYKTDNTRYGFEEYYKKLLQEAEAVERIELLSSVPPGLAQKYLVDLTQALQTVVDQLEHIHTRALFFAGKVQSAKRAKDTLQAAFSVWYQVAAANALKDEGHKFPITTIKSLADSEFDRLLTDNTDMVPLEGLEAAIDMLIDHLKGAKMLAKDKYKIGTDQANAAIIKSPGMGLSSEEPFALLKQKYGLKTDQPPAEKPQYDDEDEEDAPLPVDPNPGYVDHRELHQAPITESTIKILDATVEQPVVAEVTEDEIPAAVEEWKASLTKGEVVEDPFLGEIKLEEGKIKKARTGQEFDEPAATPKPKPKFDDEEDEEAPAKPAPAPKAVKKYDDEDEEEPAPAPSTKPKKERKRILFDDPPF